MFGKTKISATERARLLDFLLYRLKQGGNIHSAIKRYMEGNTEKRSRPVGVMLEKMGAGQSFSEAAREIGFLDESGAILIDNAPNPYLALKTLQEMQNKDSLGSVSNIWLSTLLKQWGIALAIALSLSPLGASKTLTTMYASTSAASISLGGAKHPLPQYIAEPWLLTEWVVMVGAALLLVWMTIRLLARTRVDLLYRCFRFRYFEEWVPILDIYLALKRAGHSDSHSARVIATISRKGFIHDLFSQAADNLKSRGKGLFETFSGHRGAIPAEVLGYLMDGEKTGQRDVYIAQARDYCVHALSEMQQRAARWVPTILGNVNILVFGLVMADLTIDIVNVMIRPLVS